MIEIISQAKTHFGDYEKCYYLEGFKNRISFGRSVGSSKDTTLGKITFFVEIHVFHSKRYGLNG